MVGQFCQWTAGDSEWRCTQCQTAVPASLFESKPVSVCPMWGRPEPPQAVPSQGVGTELKKLLKMIGITARGGCACNSRASKLDQWGPDACEDRLEEIVSWLREEAAKRRLPFVDAAGRLIIKRAISNARREAASCQKITDSQSTARSGSGDTVP